MKIELLEAMPNGTTVVTTTDGAEGLSVVDGRHAFVADEDDAIVERAGKVLLDNDLGQQVTRVERALGEDHYSPPPVVTQMDSIYHHPLAGNE